MTDQTLCPECGGKLSPVFNKEGIVYKFRIPHNCRSNDCKFNEANRTIERIRRYPESRAVWDKRCKETSQGK